MRLMVLVVALLTAACDQAPTAPSVNDQVPCVIGYRAVPNVGCVPR